MSLLKKWTAKQDHHNSSSAYTLNDSSTKQTGGNHKKSSNYIDCKIQLLNDGEQAVEFSIKKTDKGQKLYEMLWDHLGNINERDYFGFRYTDKYRQRRWLDLNKVVFKQLKESKSFGMCFRVKHYPKNPLEDFQSETAKRLLFLQIRRDLAQGRLLCDSSEAGILGALVVQALHGDAPNESQIQEERSSSNNALQEPWDVVYKSRIVFNQTEQTEDNIRKEHKKLRGETAEQAIDQLLDLASRLPTYGIDPFEVKPLHKVHLPKSPERELVPLPKDCSFYLGITGDGIVTFIRLERAEEYLWDNIHHLACDGKQFLVYLKKNSDHGSLVRRQESRRTHNTRGARSSTLPARMNHDSSYGEPSKGSFWSLHPKLDVLTFVCTSKAAALALWHWAVDRKCFFTLNTAKEAKKVRSAKTLFSRNHTFRFSGRPHHEIHQGRANVSTADRVHTLLQNLKDDQTRSTFPGRIRAKIDTTQDRHSGLENITETSPITSPDLLRISPSADHVTNLVTDTNHISPTDNISPKPNMDKEASHDEDTVIDMAQEPPIEQVQVGQQFKASYPQGDVTQSPSHPSGTEHKISSVEMDIHKRQEQVVNSLDQTIKNHSNLSPRKPEIENTNLISNGEIHNVENRTPIQNGPAHLLHGGKLENHIKTATEPDSKTSPNTNSTVANRSDASSRKSKASKFTLVMLVLMFFVGIIAILEATPKPNPEHNRNALFRFIRANPLMVNLDNYVYHPVRSTLVQYFDSFWGYWKK